MDGILIAKPVRTFDLHSKELDELVKGTQENATRRVVHMPSPIVLSHVLPERNALSLEPVFPPNDLLRVQR